LTIHTEVVQVDIEHRNRIPAAREGEYVCLTVHDTGTGIPPEILPRIFDPFFTTKATGKGTGLGLATAYGIMEQHQGWIEVASSPGQGACFRVYFPSLGHSPDSPSESIPATASGGTETLLLVEDEPHLRDMVVYCLRQYGYRVFAAGNGPEALDYWADHQCAIAMLVTDLVMPGGLSGRDLAQRLQCERPGLLVLYTSGYSADVAQGLELIEEVNYLPKPYQPERLARLVRQVLDQAKAKNS
jgi:CheY-like chemotaxis protein